MTTTLSVHTTEYVRVPAVGGLRVLGHRRLFRLDDRGRSGARGRPLHIGRDPACDIWLADPAVSAVHCTIVTTEGGLVLRDFASKNGTYVSTSGRRGRFARVSETPLSVGLHVRLGGVTLVAVDENGACPFMVWDSDDLMAQAHALYGSVRTAARLIGLAPGRIRRLLGNQITR